MSSLQQALSVSCLPAGDKNLADQQLEIGRGQNTFSRYTMQSLMQILVVFETLAARDRALPDARGANSNCGIG